ncbi:hypothetical protein OEZ86_001959 [Tetradesmus obliquus]|nr:hypothetical protein OEZ86_001959 [Tetradesmus obliquus]
MQATGAAGLPWRTAPQPDIVRAAQKDDLYLQQSIDACYDAVMRMFGAVPALQHSKSCRLLASFMYYALTTGAGLQTLGEEYCDILQITRQQLQLPAASSSMQQQQQQQPAGGMMQANLSGLPQQQQQQQASQLLTATWCTEKPECPLCRTAVVPSQLVCVYHSDF